MDNSYYLFCIAVCETETQLGTHHIQTVNLDE